MKRILLVEDDASLQEVIKEQLGEAGYEVFAASTKAEAIQLIRTHIFNLAIIDVGLPDGSGFGIPPELNGKNSVPFIFLTAMNSAEYRLEGYELGAADYMPKPFHMRELLLRIKKAIGSSEESEKILLHGIELDLLAKNFNLKNGGEVAPAVKDFDLLLFLVQNRMRIVSRQELLEEVFDDDTHPRTIDNAIVRLRQHLSGLGEDRIRSVRGVGYQWVEPTN